jgi:hypothetical protein
MLEWKNQYENLMTLAEALELVESLKDENWRLPTKTEILDFYWNENGFLNGFAEYFALEDLDDTTTFQQVIQVRPKDLKSTLLGKKDKKYLKLCRDIDPSEKVKEKPTEKVKENTKQLIARDLRIDKTYLLKDRHYTKGNRLVEIEVVNRISCAVKYRIIGKEEFTWRILGDFDWKWEILDCTSLHGF